VENLVANVRYEAVSNARKISGMRGSLLDRSGNPVQIAIVGTVDRSCDSTVLCLRPNANGDVRQRR
jgi:hypothetical protein